MVKVVTVLGIVVALIGLSVVMYRRTTRTSLAIDALREELATVRSQPASQVVLREVRTEVAAPTSSGNAEADLRTFQKRTERSDVSPEEEEKKNLVVHQKQLEFVENTHAAEAVDRQWAATAQRAIKEKFAEEKFAPLQMQSDCRSSLCRVDVTFSDPITGTPAAAAFLHTQPWSGVRLSVMDTAKGSGTSYFVREGFRLPVDPELSKR